MTFQKAVKIFDRANAQGDIPNRKDGGTHSLPTGRRDVIVSAARRALHRATDVADVAQVDIEPYAETLADHAYRYAQEEGLSRPANYRSRVRLFLLVVEGHDHTYQRYGPHRVLPGWRQLYAALERVMEREGYDISLRSALLSLQYLTNLRGIESPEDLPDRRTLDTWGEEDGISTRYMRRSYQAYRLACGELGAEALPHVDLLARSNERGPRSLENLPQLLEDAGYDGNPFDLHSKEIVQLLAPKLTKAVRRYLKNSSGNSNAHVTKVWGATGRILADAIRLGYDPESFSFYAAFEPTVEGTVKEDDLLNECPTKSDTKYVPPMDLIVESWAIDSWENSPLRLADATARHGDGQYAYTNTIQQDLRIAFQILNRIYGVHLRTTNPNKWRDLRSAYLDLKDRIREHNKGHDVKGQKDKERILDAITWPQLVCIGLPAVRRKVYKLRGRYFRQVERHGDLDVRAVHDARTRYHSWLRRYVTTAIVADDGLRIKNYAGALVGQNIFPKVETGKTADGTLCWTALLQVETKFRGLEADFAALKTKRNENNRERQRNRYLLPGIVDHDLLLDYWRDVRPYDLSRAGLVDDESEFDPEQGEDGFALFISPGSTNEHGRYNPNQLSETVGKTLHWICREILGREVPDWDSEERTTEWRELFGAHIVRLLIGTYWGGLRRDWSYAMRLTDDKKATLEKSYDAGAGDSMQKKMACKGWEHPHFFDEVLDSIRQRETIDWDQLRKTHGLP